MRITHVSSLVKQITRWFNQKAIYLTTSIILLASFAASYPNYLLGNIFFGQVKGLYNVKLANILFQNASYPLIGKATPYAHHQLSRTFFIEGNNRQAIKEALEELQIYPDHIATYYIVGLTYGYMNEAAKAIEAFSKYITYNPSTWAARNDMAWLQFRTGDIDGAISTISPAYTYYPDNPWVLNTYGVLLMNKKDYVKAKQILTHGSEVVSKMNGGDWGKAYPGNDPRIYSAGLSAMQQSLADNLATLEAKMNSVDKNKK